MHTVPAIDHWPPVPPPPRQPSRRSPSVALLTEFTGPGASRRRVGRGPTVSDAIFDAWSSLPAAGDWRLARFFPVADDAR